MTDTANFETPSLVLDLPNPVAQLDEAKIEVIKKPRKKRAPKHDFQDGNGRTFAHKHANGGGWVADTATVDETVYVGRRCQIYDKAIVKGLVRLENNAKISGSAVVSGGVKVCKNAHIYGSAVVRDKTLVEDDVRIFGNAYISGTSNIFSAVQVFGSAQLFSTAVRGRVAISGIVLVSRSNIDGSSPNGIDLGIEIKGNCAVINSEIRGYAKIDQHAQILRSNIVCYDNRGVHVLENSLVADQSYLYFPVIIKEHAVIVHSTLNGQTHDVNVLQIGGRTVLQHQTFNSASDLQNYMNLLALNSGRLGAAQISPNGSIVNFAARHVNWDTTPQPRRVMRLEDATP